MPKTLSLSPTRFATSIAELDLTAASCTINWNVKKPYLQLKIGEEQLKYYLADLTEYECTVAPPSSLRFRLTNKVARASEFWIAQGATTPGWKVIALQGEEVKRCRAAFLENRAASPSLVPRTEPTGAAERSPLATADARRCCPSRRNSSASASASSSPSPLSARALSAQNIAETIDPFVAYASRAARAASRARSRDMRARLSSTRLNAPRGTARGVTLVACMYGKTLKRVDDARASAFHARAVAKVREG